MKTSNISLLAACAIMLTGGAKGLQASTINLGTGQLPGIIDTASDPIWRIASAPSGNTSGPAVLIGTPIWGAAPAGLHWISSDPVSPGGSGYSSGDYTYTTGFSGAGLLNFSVKADNAVTVLLDGNAIYDWGDATGTDSSGWATFSPAQSITTSALPSHTLDLRVHNNSIYTGVLLDGSFTPAPEPATYTMLLGGAVLVVIGRLRRTRHAIIAD